MRHITFLFEKAILPKVVSRGKFINFVSTWEIFPHTWEQNKNRALWKCVDKVWLKMDGEIFRTVLKAYHGFGNFEFFGRIESCTAATRIPMLFFQRNQPWNMSYFLCVRTWMLLLPIIQLVKYVLICVSGHRSVTFPNYSTVKYVLHLCVRCYFCQIFKWGTHFALMSHVLAILMSSLKPHYHISTPDITFAFAIWYHHIVQYEI